MFTEKQLLQNLVEETVELPDLNKPEVLPLWFPENWLGIYWLNKFSRRGLPPVVKPEDRAWLDDKFPTGWSLCYRPYSATRGKGRRKAAFEKGASWCVIPRPTLNRHKFRVKDLLKVLTATVIAENSNYVKANELEIQVIDGNWVPVRADIVPSQPAEATIGPKYKLKPVWYRNYNSFFAQYSVPVDIGIDRDDLYKWPSANVTAFDIYDDKIVRDIVARYGKSVTEEENGLPIIPDFGKRFLRYMLNENYLSYEFEDIVVVRGDIRKGVSNRPVFSISMVRYPDDAAFVMRNWRGELNLERVQKTLERLFYYLMPDLYYWNCDTPERKKLIENIEDRIGVLKKRKTKWIIKWQSRWPGRPGVPSGGDAVRLATLLIHEPEFGVSLLELLAEQYSKLPKRFDTTGSSLTYRVERQWELLSYIFSVVQELDAELAESGTVGQIKTYTNISIPEIPGRLESVQEQIITEVNFSPDNELEIHLSAPISDEDIVFLNDNWYGYLYVRFKNRSAQNASELIVAKMFPTMNRKHPNISVPYGFAKV